MRGGELDRVVAGLVEQVERQFYGKYRGFVVDADDPAHLGRLKVRVPSLLGDEVVTGWAAPCVPYGGAPGRGQLFLPEPGAGVWVEFEEGDLEFPIWVGTFWSSPGSGSELPRPNGADGSEAASEQAPPTCKIVKTGAGHTLQFEDAAGAEAVRLVDGAHGHRLVMDADGVALVDGLHGHALRFTAAGVELTDGVNGNKLVLGGGGIGIGGDAGHPLVLGDSLKTAVASFMLALNAHTHATAAVGPPSVPTPPVDALDVPLSTRNTVG